VIICSIYETDAVAAERSFSSTQVELPAALRAAVLKAAAAIPDEDLATDGREDRPHVTVKYGLHTSRAADVAPLLAKEPPVTLTLGKTAIFAAKPGGPDYDVVYVAVNSPALHRLNTKIAKGTPVTDTHPTYQPHATLAYVKAGRGARYAGLTSLQGRSAVVDTVVFSSKDKTETLIRLGG